MYKIKIKNSPLLYKDFIQQILIIYISICFIFRFYFLPSNRKQKIYLVTIITHPQSVLQKGEWYKKLFL